MGTKDEFITSSKSKTCSLILSSNKIPKESLYNPKNKSPKKFLFSVLFQEKIFLFFFSKTPSSKKTFDFFLSFRNTIKKNSSINNLSWKDLPSN